MSGRSWATRGFLAAIVVGFILRLAWVIWATASPSGPYSDTAQLLGMAEQFSHLDTYKINGVHSAFHPPGYSLLLAPFVHLARVTGVASAVFTASLVNVVAGTVSVLVGGLLAGRWFGARARTVSAWLLALAPGQIYLTNVALSETVFTAFVLLLLLLVTVRLIQPAAAPTRAWLLGIGALTGYAVLVRTPGGVLLLVAVVALVRRFGGVRAAVTPVAWLLLGAVVVLVPWTLRNGVQVGVWTPTSTNNAAFLCSGHHDGATGQFETDLEDQRYCFQGTPFAEDPDEAAWYGRTARRAVGWALTHPVDEVRLTAWKTYDTMAHDREALSTSRDFGARHLASARVEGLLDSAADAWHYGVLALAALALATRPAARRAWPIWSTATGLLVLVWGGIALGRYHQPIMPLLALLGSATIVAMASQGRDDAADVDEDEPTTVDDPPADDTVTAATGTPTLTRPAPVGGLDDEVPPPADEGMALASEPGSVLGGLPGHPVHPLVATVALAAFVTTVLFDLGSFAADEAWAFAKAAYVLAGLGVGVGVIAAIFGLNDLVRVPRGTEAFRTGVRHLACMDATLALFALSFVLRRSSDFARSDPVDVLPFALSLLGLATVTVGALLGRRLAYTHGVRVNLGAARRAGFEPDGAGSAAGEVEERAADARSEPPVPA